MLAFRYTHQRTGVEIEIWWPSSDAGASLVPRRPSTCVIEMGDLSAPWGAVRGASYRVRVDDEPARDLMPRTVRTIQALLSTRATGNALRTRRTKTARVLTFVEVPIAGDDNRFVERTIRIAPLPAPEAAAARASIRAAIPTRAGRVI
jgi:hypothetical protein